MLRGKLKSIIISSVVFGTVFLVFGLVDIKNVFGSEGVLSFRLVRQVPTDVSSRIASTIETKKMELRKAIAELNGAILSGADQRVKEEKEELETLVNEINAYKGKLDNLTEGEVKNLSDFKQTSKYKEYKKKATSLLLQGKYVPQMYFAGAATRLKKGIKEILGKKKADELAGPMYFVDIWEVVKELKNSGKNLEEYGLGYIEEYEIPKDAIEGLGMGPRQLIQLNLKLTQLAKENNKDPKNVLSNQKIVLHINSEIEDKVRKDLVQHDFYGFNPENVAIVVQPVLPGYKIDASGKVVIAPESKKEDYRKPYGHGYATMQITQPGEGYIIDRQNNEHKIPGTVKEHLLEKGGELIAAHRINDMQKWTNKVVDLDKLAYSWYLINKKGHNMIVDLVRNVKDARGNYQKGGLYLRNEKTGRNFLMETINTKTERIERKLSELNDKFNGIPYNSFRQITLLEKFSSQGLRWNIRVRTDGNYLYPELVTGDLTGAEWANSIGIMKEGEEIKDFKKLANLETAIEKFLPRQDSQENFRKLIMEFFVP